MFTTRHKRSDQDFTRDRMLTFRALAVLMLTKGTRSLQLRMNTFLPKLGKAQRTVDKSAYSRARHKLKHTAFIELNQEAVVATMYEDKQYQTWQGHRVLAIDGSKLQLPDTAATAKAFGTWTYKSQQNGGITGTCTMALGSVLYDVLNRVAVDARLERCDAYEVDIAKKHLKHTAVNDLVIYDRGYCSFRMMALTTQAKGDFLIRCRSRRSFQVAEKMLAGKGSDDVIVTIKPSKNTKVKIRNEGLPTELTVRFVRVALDTGEYEVLATSLLDQKRYPLACFKELYYLRWNIETFYGTLKTRLHLENFTGLSPEAIRQDFFATIFLTGVESILTLEAETVLSKQKGGLPKKVNKAVSFNVIKEQAFELFYSKQPNEQRLKQLTDLFLSSPTLIRKGRNPKRVENSSRQVLNFWKRQRKIVF
jgi:hypothetical protein